MPAMRDRSVLATHAGLLAVTIAAWVALLRSPMRAEDMAGMHMVTTPSTADAAAYVVAWGVMMAAMMLPSALPMIGLYAATQRNARALVRAGAVTAFVAAYIGLWALSGLPMYFSSLALMAATPGVLVNVTAGVLVIAGVFQLSPLKLSCLRRCRGPLGFFMGHWRGGWRGGLTMGWAHACYCLGCCWALMIVLVVAGAMGLPWVLLIGCVVAAEKLLPGGEWIARASGGALVLLGGAVLVHPGLAATLRLAPV
jgi:predicted metal-binding membrane protein